MKALRELSRRLFPTWSRSMRARWVLAKMRVNEPRVGISAGWSHNRDAYFYARANR